MSVTYYNPENMDSRVFKDGTLCPAGWLTADGMQEWLRDNEDDTRNITLEEAKASKLAEVLERANLAYQEVTTHYSIPEQKAWEVQKAQAEALLKDENAVAPEVRALAANRNIPVLIFAERILGNATRAEQLTLQIILQQQSYEDQLNSAQTFGEVEAIEVNYILPTKESE